MKALLPLFLFSNLCSAVWWCTTCSHELKEHVYELCDIEHPYDAVYLPMAPHQRPVVSWQRESAPSPEAPPIQAKPLRIKLKRAQSAPGAVTTVKTKRPPNKFFLYKQDHLHDQEYTATPMAHRVAEIGRRWHAESASVKKRYTERQEAALAKFKEEHPDYTYQPQRRPPRLERAKSLKPQKN